MSDTPAQPQPGTTSPSDPLPSLPPPPQPAQRTTVPVSCPPPMADASGPLVTDGPAVPPRRAPAAKPAAAGDNGPPVPPRRDLN